MSEIIGIAPPAPHMHPPRHRCSRSRHPRTGRSQQPPPPPPPPSSLPRRRRRRPLSPPPPPLPLPPPPPPPPPLAATAAAARRRRCRCPRCHRCRRRRRAGCGCGCWCGCGCRRRRRRHLCLSLPLAGAVLFPSRSSALVAQHTAVLFGVLVLPQRGRAPRAYTLACRHLRSKGRVNCCVPRSAAQMNASREADVPG